MTVSPKPPRFEPPTQPHDALVQWAFSQREHATSLLAAALPPALVAAVHWGTLRVETDTFVDRALKGRYCDLLFSARMGDDRIYFYTLVEHQRKVQPLMIFRIGLYMMRLWERLVTAQPTLKKLPPIMPLLLHHSKRGWTAATAFQDVVAGEGAARAALEAHIPHFELILIDLSEGRARHLADQGLTALAKLVLWCLSVAGDDERLEREIGHMTATFAEALRAPDGHVRLEVLLRYLAATHQRLRAEKIRPLLEKTAGPEAQEVIVTFLDEIELKGKREGIREGELKGRANTLLDLLEGRFGVVPGEVRARVMGASEVMLVEWTGRVLTAATLEGVVGSTGSDNAAAPGKRPAARKRAR